MRTRLVNRRSTELAAGPCTNQCANFANLLWTRLVSFAKLPWTHIVSFAKLIWTHLVKICCARLVLFRACLMW